VHAGVARDLGLTLAAQQDGAPAQSRTARPPLARNERRDGKGALSARVCHDVSRSALPTYHSLVANQGGQR